MNGALSESALQFGENGRLLGILTTPRHADSRLPVVVIPNTGIEHRVGPNRLHVQVARALSARGYICLRFDLAGLGDSDPVPGAAPSAAADLAEALDALDLRFPGSAYTLIGLCSGAHDAHQFGKTDARVSGLFLIDGYSYPTPAFTRKLWFARLAHPLRTATRGLAQIKKSLGTAKEPEWMDFDFVRWPSMEATRADYQAMLGRGMHLAFLFTGDIQGDYLYAEQHYDCFPFLKGWARVWHFPGMDHTLTRVASRQQVIAIVRDWLQGLQGGQGSVDIGFIAAVEGGFGAVQGSEGAR